MADGLFRISASYCQPRRLPPLNSPMRCQKTEWIWQHLPLARGTDPLMIFWLQATPTPSWSCAMAGWCLTGLMGLATPIGRILPFPSRNRWLACLLVGILVEAGVSDPEQQLTYYLPEIAGSAYEGASLAASARHDCRLGLCRGLSRYHRCFHGLSAGICLEPG